MKILSLNCQRGHQSNLKDHLDRVIASEEYDFLLLQEIDDDVITALTLNHYVHVGSEEICPGQKNLLSIFYKQVYPKIGKLFCSFAPENYDGSQGGRHKAFGILSANFLMGQKEIRLVTIHLHSGMSAATRRLEIRKIKELLVSQKVLTLIAGDFNFGYPNELSNAKNILAPEFVCITDSIGPTLDGRYSEKSHNLPNRISYFLNKFGINIKLSTDHIFADPQTANTITYRVLTDRVSDHSPIEINLTR